MTFPTPFALPQRDEERAGSKHNNSFVLGIALWTIMLVASSGMQRTVDTAIDHFITVSDTGVRALAYLLFTVVVLALLYVVTVALERDTHVSKQLVGGQLSMPPGAFGAEALAELPSMLSSASADKQKPAPPPVRRHIPPSQQPPANPWQQLQHGPPIARHPLPFPGYT